MQFFVLLSLLVEISVSTKAAKPRSINVALDTVFEFDKSSDVDFINQVQGFLTKVKNKIKDKPKQDENEYTMRAKQYKFTNFLEDLIDTVLTFNDKDLMEIVQIVKNEIQENKHSDILQEKIRRFLNNELNHIKEKPVKTIRKDLDKLLRKLQKPKKDNNDNILGFINTLYKRDTQEKLSNFIKKLKIFRQRSRKSGQLQHTVRKAVQLIIVDYFSNLSKDTKRKVEDRLKAYLRDDFSVHSSKTYPIKQKEPLEIKRERELVLKNSEDTNTDETIEIEAKSFKSHRNNYIPYLIQDGSENTEVMTKKIAKNEIVNVKQKKVSYKKVVSIDKVTKKESHVTSEGTYTNRKYSTNTSPQITYLKPKRSHNKKNKGKGKTTKLSTKTYVTNKFLNVKQKNYNEGVAMSIEKESGDGKSKEIYSDHTPQAAYSKPRRSHTKKSKKRSRNASIKYLKGKLTHITLYPEIIKIERRNFRAPNEDKNNEAKNKRTLDDVTLTSISYSAEINVSLKNNKIKLVYDDNNDKVRKDTLMKVRAFRQKLMENRTTGDNKDFTEHHSKSLNIKRKDINTPKPSVAYFGNLFKSKGVTVDDSDSRQFVDSETDDTHKVKEYFKQIDNKIETRNTENINKVTTIITGNKLDEKQRDFRANNDNDFQEKEDYRPLEQVAENKSAKKLKMIDITTENDLLTTSGYRPKPRQDANIADNKPDNKFKTIVITTESYDRLAEELNIKENISHKNIKRNEITTKNYEEFEEYNFVENKPERNLTTTEITTGDIFLNKRGFRRIKEPKIIDKINLNISRNDINAISKSNKDVDIKVTLTSNFDYIMESTTRQKIKNIHRTLPPETFNSKADKIIKNVNEKIVHKIRSDHSLRKSTKTTKKTVKHQSTYRKTISEQITNKIVELPTQFIEKVTKNNNMNKISKHINIGRDMHEIHDTSKIQSIFTSNNKNNNLKITTNMNKDNQFKSGDIFKRINTQIINIRKQTNVNPTTKSYIKDIKPLRNKINDSRRQLNINSKATTHKYKELDAGIKENYKISTAAVNPISLDPKKVTKNKDDKHNHTKLIDLRKNLKTTPIIVFKDEFLDTEFKEAIINSEKDPVPIDIQKYIKNPEVADVGDEKKKKEIEQKMKEELSYLFTSPSTMPTTTEAYTDIFEAMDNEFDLGPLK